MRLSLMGGSVDNEFVTTMLGAVIISDLQAIYSGHYS